MNRPTPAPQAHGPPGNPHAPGPLSYPAPSYHPQGGPMGALGPNPGQMQPGGMQGGIPAQLTGGGMQTQLTGGGVPNGANGAMGQMFFTSGPPGGPGGVGRGGVPVGPGGSAGMQGMGRGGMMMNGQLPRYVTGPGGPPTRLSNGMAMPAGMGMTPAGMGAPNGMTISMGPGGPGGMPMQGGMAVGRGAPPGSGQPMMPGGMPGMGLRRMTSAPNLHGSVPPGYPPSNPFPPQQPGSMQQTSMSIPSMPGQHLIMPSQPQTSQPGPGPGQPKPGQPQGIQGMTFQQQLGGTGMPQQGMPQQLGHMGQQPMQMQPSMQGNPMSMGGGTLPMGLGPTPMGVNPMGTPMAAGLNSGAGNSPNRNPSPGQPGGGSAGGTPANAGTPGGPRGRGTPVNSQPPYPASAPTPSNRPGTAPHQTPIFPQQTPRMQQAEPITYQNAQASPRQVSRQPSTNNPALQPGQGGSMLPPGSLPQGGSMAHPGSTAPPQSSASTPGPSSGMNPNITRNTPAQVVTAISEVFAPGGNGLPPGYATGPYGPPGPQRQPQPMGRPQWGGPQQPPPGGPLQPQHTGPQPPGAPLQPQHTGGSIHDQPMQPQHTGGSPAQSGPAPGRRSVPGTPSMSRAGMVTNPSPRMPNYSMHMGNMGPPPPPGAMEGILKMPPEVADVTMSGMGMPEENARQRNFGILRLLQFSDELRSIQGHGEDYWTGLLNRHFTEDAVFKFRARRNFGTMADGFVEMQGNLLVRFFDTFTRSNIFQMGIVLDGARESEDRHKYFVSCSHARWWMQYDSGWISEILGTVTATCKTVPLKPSEMPEDLFPPLDDQRSGSHSSSSIKQESSPHNPATAAGSSDPSNNRTAMDVDSKPNSQVRPLPYIVKISELSFDSLHHMQYVDRAKMKQFILSGQPPDGVLRFELPPEPATQYGLPAATMRTIDLSEANYAMVPIMDSVGKNHTSPMNAMFDYAQFGGFPMGPYGMQRMMGMPSGLPEGEEAYVSNGPLPMFGGFSMGAHNPSGVGIMPQSMGINPSSISTNGPSSALGPSSTTAPAASGNDTPGTSSNPSNSPTLSTKPPSKKGSGAPSSPTKANAGEKGGKRKNTTDNEGPPSKRTRGGGGPNRKTTKG